MGEPDTRGFTPEQVGVVAEFLRHEGSTALMRAMTSDLPQVQLAPEMYALALSMLDELVRLLEERESAL